MKIIKQWFARQKQNASQPGPRIAASPLLLALEPRVVYDASVAAVAAQPHAHEHAPAEVIHRTEAHIYTPTGSTSNNATANAPADKPQGSDPISPFAQNRQQAPSTQREAQHAATTDGSAAMSAAQTQVVFIDPSVANYQVLIAGLPAGTQYVVLDAKTDGLAQIAQYLQAHRGVESISLLSHGSDGAIQVGSTWLTNGDLSGYSTQLAQIGAAMHAGGDFLIYGCDVAQQADGQALVQKIAGISHLNVAASIDATGSAALGGNWTLEYQVGNVHTALNESASAQAQFNELLGVTTETYDSAAADNFAAIGLSQFTLDGLVYTFDQPGNTYAYNASNSPFPSDISVSPTDGVLDINADGASTMSNVTISLANGHQFSLQSFDLSSFNGDLYIQATYANGSKSALVQLATAAVGGFTGTVSSQIQLGSAFNNIVSFSLIDQNDSGSFEPTLNNLAYTDNGPSVTTSSGSASWSSSDNGVGGTAVAVDPGITISDPSSASASTATVRITNVQSGDQLSFIAQNGITGSYNSATGVLTLTGSGSPSLASWQAALQSITFFSTQASPNLSTTTRTVSFAFNDGTEASNVATRTITVTSVDQTPLVTEGGATSTSYFAGSAAVAVDANVHVSDADTPTLTSGAVTIASGYATGDTLAFNNSNVTLYGNIIGSYNATTHALTLTSAGGTATVAQWQNAFDAVTFASATGTTGGTRDITFAVSDGTKTSALLHHSMVVTAGPTVSTDSGSAQFVSGDNTTSTPVAVDPGILLTDGSSTTLVSATVAITGNFQGNHDQLLFTANPATMGNISGAYDGSTGVLTLTAAGGASLLQWQNALASIQFTNDLVVPSSSTRTVSFQINDGTLTSSTATRNVTVTATDQTPVIGAGGNTVSFVAGDNTASTAVAVNDAITVGDLDGGPLQQAVVTITGHYEATDVLAFNNNSTALYGNISAVYANGTLTLTSSGNQATLAQWQNALRAVTYDSTAITPGALARTVSFAISDGTKTSTAATSTVTVADTDQTPVIGGSSGSLTFTQGDNVPSTPVVIDSGITVSDRDNATLTQANVVIASGYDANGDTLLFTNDGSTMGNITGAYSNGVLALSSAGGTATLAQWQAALRSVRFTDSAATPDGTQRVINFVITDGTKVSTNFQRTINVVPTDQSPIVTDSGGTTTFVSGDNAPSAPVVVDAGLTLTDSDSATMASATVAITGNFHSGEDVLALGNGAFGDIQAHFDAGTGTLTLTSAGGSTAAQWQAALRSVTYTDTAVVPQTASRTISFSANDGTKSSVGSSKVIVVQATHQTPLVGASGNSLDYLTGQAATAIDSGITLTDRNVSGSTLVPMSITVQITAGLQSGDTLGISVPPSTLTNGMNVNYDAASGTLTISSTGGTVAQWQTVLDSLQFSTGANAALGTRTVSVVVNDGVKTSSPLDYSVNVISSAPALGTSSTGSASFVAGDNASAAPVAIDPNLTVADPLGNVVDGAVIAITGNLYSGEDRLSFSNDGLTMGNITGSYDTSTGMLTLTSANGSATLAQWQAALRSVAYSDTQVTPNDATRTVSFSLSAGSQFSNALTRTIVVTPTEQTPLLSTSSTGSAAFVAADNAASTPVAIDTGIAVTDLDNATLAAATVQIGAGFHAGQDVLAFTNDRATMGNITAAYDAAHGTLTLVSAGGTATLAQWQAALRSVTYTDTAVTPDTATRTIGFAVSDGAKTSVAITRDVTVATTDQTPTLSTTSSGPAAFVAGDNTASVPVTIDGGLTLSDLDNATLASATVQIGAGFHAGEDVLAFSNDGTMGNITASFDAAHGTLTLVSAGGTATLAQWQAALRSVTYTDTAVTPDATTRSIGFSINDGVRTSAAYSRDVSVAATDQTPLVGSTASGSTAFVSADNAPSQPVTVDSGITLSDRDNATLASATVQIGAGFHAGQDVLGFVNDGATMGNITAAYDAAHGTLTLVSAGGTATLAQWQAALRSVTYTDTAVTPDTATRTIGFAVNDGAKTSVAFTRDVTVATTDQTPTLSTTSSGPAAFVAGDNAASVPVTIDGSLTLSDLDNATLAAATVQIGAGFHAGEDVLAFSNDGTMGNITANFDAAHGTLTLVSAGGTATLAQWQAALRSVTYTDTAVTPDATTRSIGFTINDGVKTSAALERSVSVTATHQTPLLGVDGTQLSYTAGGRVTVPVSIGTGITLTDLNATAPTTATIALSGAFDAQHDVLSFAAGAATGDIAASFDAAHGTLTLHSASGNATVAQWQAALTAVGYLHTQAEHTGSTRTLVFTVGDGVKTSAPLTRTLTIVGTAQPVGTPILPQWVLPHDQNGQPDREQTGAMPIGLPHAAPLLADDSLGQSDGVSSPLIVLDAFGATSQRDVGSIGTRDTFTFASHGARERSLGDTHVRPLDSLVPAGIEGATPAAHPLAPIDVHPLHRAGQDFAVNVRTLVQTPATRDAQAPGADDAAVTAVTLANGAPLPAWLHYDAQSGVLSGKPPAGVHDVRVTLVQRDAAGNLVRREVTMRFDAHGNAAGKPAEHGKGNGHAVAPHAQAAPVAKPSLAAQFANALATLHVTGERRS
ncbi:DUF4347 domain-containing protein [Burkholderia vietnamiensis]|uniref:DUF4347 domain-containing protein n=1 Tax=Burkholderia vietnamiensis TaxID=60552 RepID=UPI0039B52439